MGIACAIGIAGGITIGADGKNFQKFQLIETHLSHNCYQNLAVQR
jgi:hypothetical protein